MTRNELFYAIRFVVLSTVLVIPLLGCICGDEELHSEPMVAPTSAASCDTSGWTPERIELLDMSDFSPIEEDSSLTIVPGTQGSDMVGVYVAVYGDDIPECLRTGADLEGFSGDIGDFDYESDGPRRAETPNPVYWVIDGTGASTLSVTVGGMTVEHEVAIDY